MGVDHRLLKTNENFRGLDLRSSDIMRSQEFSTDMRNASYRISGAINKRKGFQHKRATGTIKGMTTFKNISSNGAVTDELVYVEDNNVKKEVSFNLVGYRSSNITGDPVLLDIQKQGSNTTIKAVNNSGTEYYNKTFTSSDTIQYFLDHFDFRGELPEGSASPIIDWNSLSKSDLYLSWSTSSSRPLRFNSSTSISDVIYLYVPVSAMNVTKVEEYAAASTVHENTSTIYNTSNPSYTNDLLKFQGINLLKDFSIGTAPTVHSMTWVDATFSNNVWQSESDLSNSTGATHLRFNIQMVDDNIDDFSFYFFSRLDQIVESMDLNGNSTTFDWNNFRTIFTIGAGDLGVYGSFDYYDLISSGIIIDQNSRYHISIQDLEDNFKSQMTTYSGQTGANGYSIPTYPGEINEFSISFAGSPKYSVTSLDLRNQDGDIVSNFLSESISSLNTNTTEISNNASTLFPTTITVGTVEEVISTLSWSSAVYDNVLTENVNFASLNNLLYISNGVDPLLKYDGDIVYNAGLPNTKEDEFTLTAENISVNQKSAIFTATPGFVEEIGTDLGVADAETFLMPNHKYIFEFSESTSNMRTSIEVNTLPTIQTDTYVDSGGTTRTVAINVHPYQIYFAKDTQSYHEVDTSIWDWSSTTDQYRTVLLPDYGDWSGNKGTPGAKSLSGTGLKTYVETDSEAGVKSMGVHSYIDNNGDTQYHGGSGYTGYDEQAQIYSNYVDIRMEAVTGDTYGAPGNLHTKQFYEYQSDLVETGNFTYYTYARNQIAGRITIEETIPLETKKTYEYILHYEYTDYKGNIISSQQTEPIKLEVASEENVKLEFNTFNDLTSSFNLQGTFDSVWKTANGVSDDLIPATQPTINDTNPATGQNYTQQELDLLKVENQNRMRIIVYRSKGYFPSEGEVVGLYYKVADVPYSGSAVTHYDTIEDDKLNPFLVFVFPIKRKDPPPKGKYLTVFKNCLVISGQEDNVNNVQYSLPKNFATGEIGSEYFPDDDNAIVAESPFGSKITAIAALKDLMFVFHKDSIFAVSGNINQLELPTVDLVTKEGGVGCTSQASIEEFKGGLAFVSDTGIYSISNRGLEELSQAIKPLFLEKQFSKEKAISFNWTDKNLLLICIPDYIIQGDSDYDILNDTESAYISKDSLILAYDYFREAWLRWDTLEFTNGISLLNDTVNFARHTNVGNFTCLISDNGDADDYSDNGLAINFSYETNWESLGDPTVPKKFLRLKVHSFDTDASFESPGFLLEAGIQTNYINADNGKIDFDFAKQAGGGWGNFRWGTDSWGSLPSQYLKSKLPTGKARSFKIRFANNENNENVLITNYELEIAAPFRQEIKE